MSDPNGPRHEEHDDPAEQPVEGFSVTDEQHAAPSAPTAPSTPGVGEPAQSFSSPAVDPAPQAPGQPAFSEPARSEPASDDVSQGWQHGQQQPSAPQQDAYGQAGQAQQGGFGASSSAPQFGQSQPSPSGQSQPGQEQFGQSQPGQPQYGAPQSAPYGQFGQQPAQPPLGDQQYGQPPHGGQAQQPYGAPGQSSYGAPGQPQYGAPGQPQYGAPSQPQYAAGAPMSPVDEKNAGMWGHLSGLSTIVTAGWGGWIGPLIVFLIYKDRSAFARQESKEALNFGIFMTILTIGLIVVGTVLSVVGIGLLFLAFYWLPGLLQVIFSIIGGVRVNNGGSYRYPFNWRLVK